MFQDRYIAYAVKHGKTPEAMLEFDRQRYPGGVMGGFLTWHPKDGNPPGPGRTPGHISFKRENHAI